MRRTAAGCPHRLTTFAIAAARWPLACALSAIALVLAIAAGASPLTDGPGGPLLLITDPSNPFTGYYAEILRTEGFALFETRTLSELSPAVLAAHDVVLLGEMPLDDTRAQWLADYVVNGGGLIAMRPDPRLAVLLGLAPAPGAPLAERYLTVITDGGPGAGITAETMQYHGAADLYLPNGATPVAQLRYSLGQPSPYVAVSVRSLGTQGGQAATFAYDLARSVVTTRQGNPAWSGQERDALPPRRSDDLFIGGAPGDPQADWLDRTRIAIPQADEQQRLLANLIERLALHRHPLPRFWYFPNAVKAVVIMTGDDHAHGGTAGRFELERLASPPGCSAPDWECVRSTSYIYPGTPISDSLAAAYTADGFELALHLNTGCSDFTSAQGLDSLLGSQLGSLAAQLPSNPPPSSNRTHCVVWSDYTTEAHVEFGRGIRLDCTYYDWPNSFALDRPGMFTGSGIPMRFADADGAMIDVFQAASQMTDESQQSYPVTVQTLLDRAAGSEGYYGAFCANMHTDSVQHWQSAAIIAAAQLRGAPVVSSRQMLTWLDARNRSAFREIAGDRDSLGFRVDADPEARHLTALLPLQSASGPLERLERDGTSIPIVTTVIKGLTYARFEAASGQYVAHYARDEVAPLVHGPTVIPDDGGEAAVLWETDELSDAEARFGLTPVELDQSVSSPLLLTHHSLRLRSLLPDTTYYLRVYSRDAAGNLAETPASPAPALAFSTVPSRCAVDVSAEDFALGSGDAGVWISTRGTNGVALRPSLVEEFAGPDMPAGWPSSASAGGSAGFVPDGLELEGSEVRAAAPVAADASFELRIRFNAEPEQQAGLIADAPDSLRCLFVVLADSTLAAISIGAGGRDTTSLGSFAVGSIHRFGVRRDGGSVDYSLDGVTVATHALAIPGSLPLRVFDPAEGGSSLTLTRALVSPYAGAGVYLSRVFDAGQVTPR